MLAAVLERASFRYIQRAWCFTLDTLDFLIRIHMNRKLCAEKCLCIWMYGMLCNILSRNNLDDISQIHNCDLMGKRTNQCQVMADEKHTDILLFLETYQKFDHRFLYGNIQCRSCFITYQNLRFQRKCSGDTDSLSLSTTHVMRIAVHEIPWQFNHFQKFSCLGFFFASP